MLLLIHRVGGGNGSGRAVGGSSFIEDRPQAADTRRQRVMVGGDCGAQQPSEDHLLIVGKVSVRTLAGM
jgi:hypothetical protein